MTIDPVTLSGKALDLLRLHHQPDPLLLANSWDVLTARAVQAAGAKAIATTSSGVAASLGFEDGQGAPAEEMLAAVKRIAACTTLAVTADMEAGYGLAPETLAERLLDAGVVGLNIEDSRHATTDGLGSIVDAEDLARRIASMRAAAEGLGVHLVINARIDVFLRRVGAPETRLEEAIRRARVYLGAGADCVYPIGLADEPAIDRFVRAVDAPVNILIRPGTPSVSRLSDLGVARISVGGQLADTTTERVRAAAAALLDGDAGPCF